MTRAGRALGTRSTTEHKGDMFNTLQNNGNNGLPRVFGIRISYRWGTQAAGRSKASII